MYQVLYKNAFEECSFIRKILGILISIKHKTISQEIGSPSDKWCINSVLVGTVNIVCSHLISNQVIQNL